MTDSSLVFVANAGDSTISTFRLADGRLERLAVTAGTTGCSNFVVDAERDLLHAAVKPDEGHPDAGIRTFAIDRSTGSLTPQSDQALPGSAMNYVALTRDGSVLLGASYGGGYGVVCPVVDGVVGAPVAQVRFPRLHSVRASADGRFVYFVSLEADLVAQYALGDDLSLAPLSPATVACPAGSGPRHLEFGASQDDLYVLTEFSAEVLHFARDAESGVLSFRTAAPAHDTSRGLGHSVIDEDPREHHYIWGADIHLADGVLWASERTESTLGGLIIGADGAPSAPTAFTVTEPQPRGFAVSPDGRFLVAAGERSTTVSLYAVDGDRLELRQQAETGSGANWVRFG
ncbi:lactonase family protein [Microbacterium sp. 179-B 1A2 NHS]|uniref:lactonase family protein n=1 Tax=Microbacterium sp. 179-B 1A2 NHS TaxID=3142383 RepID=UPI0039A3C95C